MLNIILAALPTLGSLVSGGKADAVISAGTKIAKEVFGTTDEVSIAKAIETNPALAEQFKAKLEAETATLAAQLADVQDARATTVRLAESGSAISWGAPVISVIVVIGYLGLVFALLFKTIPDNQVTLVLFGGLSAAFAQVINYWLGSSAGSANKDVALKQIAAGKR
jgi:hypothetical protein